MTVIANAGLVLKDSQGNEGIVKSLTDNDIDKISNAITDVGQVVDPATHMPIEATKTSAGVVQLATAQDITNGTAGKVVDAKELINFAQTLPAANGITDVSSGDNSNQLVVSRIGGSKTLTIDNVEHADNADEATHASQADTAASANSVAWNNVSGKPSSYTPSSHTHDDRYYTESEIDTKLSGKSNTDHTHSNYLTGITKSMVTTALGYTPPTSDTNTHYTTTLYAGAKDAKSNAATTNGNAYLKLYDDSTVRSQLNIKGSGATTVTTDANGVITINSTDTNTTYSKLSQFTNDSGYITSSGTAATISQKVNSSAKTHTNYNTNGTYVPTMNFLSFWNGAYNSSGSSNLTYCAQGTIIGSNNIGSQSVNYATSAGSVAWSNVSSRPTKVSQFTNDSGYITGITKTMVTNALGYTPPTKDTNTWNALKGSTTSAAGTAGYAPAPAAGAANRYLRCDGTWQVPPDHTYTVNNATLTIQKNGSNVATFTANASSNVTANISVPTKVSQLTNDSGYITSSGSCNYATTAGNGVDSAGGTWIRFKNGIQMMIITGVTSNEWHNFSKSFSKLETMSVIATPVDKSTNSLAAKIHEYTTTSFFVRVYNNDNNNAQYSTACTIFAMGFWK